MKFFTTSAQMGWAPSSMDAFGPFLTGADNQTPLQYQHENLGCGDCSQPCVCAIAVLPFENLSDDREQEHFADGMTEVLITRAVQDQGSSGDLSNFYHALHKERANLYRRLCAN